MFGFRGSFLSMAALVAGVLRPHAHWLRSRSSFPLLVLSSDLLKEDVGALGPSLGLVRWSRWCGRRPLCWRHSFRGRGFCSCSSFRVLTGSARAYLGFCLGPAFSVFPIILSICSVCSDAVLWAVTCCRLVSNLLVLWGGSWGDLSSWVVPGIGALSVEGRPVVPVS